MALMPLRKHLIQDIEIELVLAALKQRWDYDFSGYARASLKRRLLQMVEYFEVDCLSRLLPNLLYDEPVAQTLINAISVPTSEFFRDPIVWLTIRKELILRLDSFPHINLWQVGCGRGQETYTLAILLHETGLLKKSRIITTDINANFLAQAKEGSWSMRDFALWERNYQLAGGTANFSDYFRIDADTVHIVEHLKTSIEFVQHNLVADDVFLETQFIVCRNVLIYFGLDLQERVFNVFSRSLERGGYLLLGKVETLLELNPHFLQLECVNDNIRLYRKAVWKGHV